MFIVPRWGFFVPVDQLPKCDLHHFLLNSWLLPWRNGRIFPYLHLLHLKKALNMIALRRLSSRIEEERNGAARRSFSYFG